MQNAYYLNFLIKLTKQEEGKTTTVQRQQWQC